MDDLVLAQKLLALDANDPTRAAELLFGPPVPGMSRTAVPASPSSAITPGGLSRALSSSYKQSLTAALLAKIEHKHFPNETALSIAQLVKKEYPDTTKSGMLSALTGAGFPPSDAQGAVDTLYPAPPPEPAAPSAPPPATGPLPRPTRPRSSAPYTGLVTVRADRGWQSGGVYVGEDMSVSLRYVSGTWTANARSGSCDPGGNKAFMAQQGYALPGAPEGALIGRLGDNGPFLIGTGRTYPGGTSGDLMLCINGDLSQPNGLGLAGNQGEVILRLTLAAARGFMA